MKVKIWCHILAYGLLTYKIINNYAETKNSEKTELQMGTEPTSVRKVMGSIPIWSSVFFPSALLILSSRFVSERIYFGIGIGLQL